jgi:hypothetical protein
MPGLALLDDDGFLRAFQVIDGIINKTNPTLSLHGLDLPFFF